MTGRRAGRLIQGPVRTLASTASRTPEWALSTLARISPTASAHVDWLQTSKHQSWGGPLNGQHGRQSLVRELAKASDITAVIETGTYRGTTTEFLWHVTGAPVYSVELNPRFYRFATRRFDGNSAIRVELGESVGFLRSLAEDPAVPKQGVLFYFDAHWGPSLPLREELRLVQCHWSASLVLVDDFQVPGDPNYGFDDYGPGNTLNSEYLDALDLSRMSVLYPSLPAEHETGARRGCCVVTSTSCAERLLRAGVALTR